MNFKRNTASAEPIISTCSNVLSSTVLSTNHLDMEKFHVLEKLYQKNSITYMQGSDPSEKFLLSKLESPAKRNHGMQVTPTARTTLNVGITVKCSECRKPRVIYAKKKLTNANIMAMKRIFNNFQYVCGTVFHDIPIDERNRDTLILELLHCRENLSCTSPIEIPYYSCKIFPKICYHCGSNKSLTFKPCILSQMGPLLVERTTKDCQTGTSG